MTFRAWPIAFLVTIALSLGCYSSGNKVDQAKVDKIQKGVTTRAEVEQQLGQPSHVSMMPDGSRTLYYQYFESQQKGTNIIPFNFHHGSTDRRKSLQELVDKKNIVKDYEFSDKTGETNANPFNASRSETPTAPAAPAVPPAPTTPAK